MLFRSNATSWGSLPSARGFVAASANNIYGVFSGGLNSSNAYRSSASYITFSTTGNASTFGNLTIARAYLSGGGDSIRALACGGLGTSGPYQTRIDQMLYASLGNASNYGSLSVAGLGCATASSPTRTVFMGGENRDTTIDYITNASGGTATSFGTQTPSKLKTAGLLFRRASLAVRTFKSLFLIILQSY